MTVLAFYSIKGGVGKTTVAVNTACLASLQGHATLLCDLDPQGSASYCFRVRSPKKLTQKRLLKGGKDLDRTIRETDYRGLDLLPSDLSYRHLDIELDHGKHPRKQLIDVLGPYRSRYEHIFLDCPPSITLLSENVFRAADIILVPVIPTPLSIMTLDTLRDFFKEAKLDRRRIRPFFSMVDRRKSIHRTIVEERKASQGFLDASIPFSAEIERMTLLREPLVAKRQDSMPARPFLNLWEEIKAIIRQEQGTP